LKFFLGQNSGDLHRADKESQNLKIMMFDPNPTVARAVLGIIKKNLLLEVRLTVHLPHEII
jgi:hypothetical protein